jgi:nucleotide-binding universal stress UspA family protein
VYRTIVLAYDGSKESRMALREGAVLAKHLGARLHLLSVVAEAAGVMLAESIHSGALQLAESRHLNVLNEGVERLNSLGCPCTAELCFGEPAPTIANYARNVGADLVIVGHQVRNMMQRWWAGRTDSFLSDQLPCSLLIVKGGMDEAAFEAAMKAENAGG